MRIAIAITLAFFAIVSAMGALRDLGRAGRDPRPSRHLGVTAACAVTIWCGYAAYWLAFQ